MKNLEKILLIDDEQDIREIAEMVLEVMGDFSVMTADCGETALSAVEAFSPDLVLSDFQMPGMTGPETLKAIRSISGFESLPGIIMTAKLVGSEAEAFLKQDDLGVIGKPFDPNTLSDQIIKLWESRT